MSHRIDASDFGEVVFFSREALIDPVQLVYDALLFASGYAYRAR